jgi:protein BCP1
MSKRKQSPSKEAESDSDSDSVSFVDVSFDFFDPNPTVDYHALKRLLKQLFQRDADAFDLGALTDLVLSQPTVGTTIKTDGLESDPYALLTVLNMHVHQAHPAIAALAAYFLDKTAQADPAFNATLAGLFRGQGTHVGLVLCERLVNMPVQTVPPMYRMLSDEIKWALADVCLSACFFSCL